MRAILTTSQLLTVEMKKERKKSDENGIFDMKKKESLALMEKIEYQALRR